MTNQIYPCLWFDNTAKEAAEFYCKIFKNSKITDVTPFVVLFELNGHKFMGLNGGPKYKMNEAVSFVINCETQVEIDYYWEKLTADGGEESMCGWLKDKYGLSWQVVPSIIGKLMTNPEKAQRVMPVILKMRKLNIAEM